jgi:hypothetical protein
MPEYQDPSKIAAYFSSMTSEQLVQILSYKNTDYQPLAIETVKVILISRGYTAEQLKSYQTEYDNIIKSITKVDSNLINFDLLGKYRDRLLLILAINYGVGYLGWSIYAMINSLGNISAFDLQYILTGIIPTSIFLLMVVYFKSTNDIFEFIDTNLNRRVKGIRFIIRMIIICTTYITSIVLTILCLIDLIFNIYTTFSNSSYSNWYINQEEYKNLERIVIAILFLSFAFRPNDAYIFGIRELWRKDKTPLLKKIRTKRRNLVKLREYGLNNLFIGFLMLGLPFFYIWIFPNIPQEIGGVATKKCILISDKNIFTVNKDTVDSKKLHQFTDTVIVYYYNSAIVIASQKKDGNKIEISRSNIQSMIWLE